MKSRETATKVLFLLLVLTALRGGMYAAVIPPWQSPEEPWHFEVVGLTHEYGRPVSASDRSPARYSEILASLRIHHFWELVPWADPDPQGGEFHQPPLYYRLASVALRAVPEGTLVEQLFLTRLVSVMLGVFVVTLAYLASMILFPDDIFLQIGVPAFIVFLPTHTISISTVNNDPLGEVVGTLAILILVIIIRRGVSLAGFLGLALTLTLGYYSKRTFVFLIPLALIGSVIAFWLHRSKHLRPWLLAWGIVVVIISGALLWNMGFLERLFDRFDYVVGSPHLGEMLRILVEVYPRYARALFESFWGMFGWGSARLSSPWFAFLALISLVAALGLIRPIVRPFSSLRTWQYAVLGMYLLALGLNIALAVAATLDLETARWPNRFKGASPQARYIFPSILPIATLITLGLRTWVPAGRERIALGGYVLALVGFDMVSIVIYIVPFFYGRIY